MFTHLHFHTSMSFLDGYNPIKKAAARIKELGMQACAITDHNHVAGCIQWQEECEALGIKPLLGMEGYFTLDMIEAAKDIKVRKADALKKAIEAGVVAEDNKLKAKELNEIIEPYMYNMHQYHILYIAKNQTGWRNLVKIQSESARLCTYNGRYLADMDLLRQYHEGIITTTACIGSYPSNMLREGKRDLAEWYIKEMKDIFGDDFYLEIQPLDIDKQHATNLFYMEMSKKYGIPVVATNDVHYTRKEDHDDHDTLLCIGTGKLKAEENRMRYSNDFWIKSEEEMVESFEKQAHSIVLACTSSDGAACLLEDKDIEEYKDFYEQAIKNTQLIADKVEDNIKLGSDKPLFSNVKVPEGFTPESYLNYMAWKGLYAYLAKHPECDKLTYEKRLHEELNIIIPKGFAPYMLAVWEYVNWANANGVPTGPGRGSAAGSLCLFSLGITRNVDPIKNQLLFSRFLTADRVEPPDWKVAA
jgi:DNA polymerase-3 subunit alpha